VRCCAAGSAGYLSTAATPEPETMVIGNIIITITITITIKPASHLFAPQQLMAQQRIGPARINSNERSRSDLQATSSKLQTGCKFKSHVPRCRAAARL
jgi:hypothetical protein